MEPDHIWRQIEGLLRHASQSVTFIAPFIKKTVFEAAVAAAPASVERIHCVTRWTPAEVAAGVSDPEIMELAESDERVRVSLCPALHAKIYIADDRCLIGSANLTGKATGRVPNANFELLIEAATAHPEVQRVLAQVEAAATDGTPHLAALVRKQAELLQVDANTTQAEAVGDLAPLWYPATRRPENLYVFYSGRATFAAAVEAGILQDLASLNMPAGLGEGDFNAAVRTRLHGILELKVLRTGESLSNLELESAIAKRSGVSDALARRRTENIAAWLQHFDQYYTEVGAWKLRQGRELA
ncbi:phospholipase D family protein [Streptomyces platensis]|uniref:phospholipase D family protein n=1 Tax=Streptomyces platensis TaxID=58346 RepID=UPI00224ECB59|nr:phospholipase D family protein [Streptomyces platensis]MCX4640193.1 phospholipase D family protein [Streptomyces platensis]